MKSISSAIFYLSERKAIFQQEYSYSEARSFQDKREIMIRSGSRQPAIVGI